MTVGAFCERCGVELEPGLETCPLCGARPGTTPGDNGEYAPLPEELGRTRIPAREIYRRTTLLVLVTALVVVTIVDVAVSRTLTWAPIVWASLVLLGGAMLGPLAMDGFARPFVTDLLLAALLLLTIDASNGAVEWFVPLGLPILGATGLIAAVVTLVFPRLRTLSSSAAVVGAAASVCVVIEIAVSRWIHGGVVMRWSWIVLIASVPVAAFLVIFEQTVGHYIDFRRRFHI